jgi:hypothetical protein
VTVIIGRLGDDGKIENAAALGDRALSRGFGGGHGGSEGRQSKRVEGPAHAHFPFPKGTRYGREPSHRGARCLLTPRHRANGAPHGSATHAPQLSRLELLLGANVALRERIRQRRRHDEKLSAVVLE